MFNRTSRTPFIIVAPTGARKTKAHHPNLPISITEIRDETVACAETGAQALHRFVRDEKSRDTLDCSHFGKVLIALLGFPIQITTEPREMFGVKERIACLINQCPRAASVSIKEIARHPELEPRIYDTCWDEGIAVQHILSNLSDWHKLAAWRASWIVRGGQRKVILALDTQSEPNAADVDDLEALKTIVTCSWPNDGLRLRWPRFVALAASAPTCA